MTDNRSKSAADVLMHLIVALLAPMFIQAANGDIDFARAAAAETVNGYRARNHIDLLTIAQIIGFGLTALGSLGLSMADNISISMTLRLRAGAVASNRAGEVCRRALAQSRLDGEPPAINDTNSLLSNEPAGVLPASGQPTGIRPASGKLTVAQPANTQSDDTHATDTLPVDTHATDTLPVDTQATDTQATDTQASNTKPIGTKECTTRPPTTQPVTTQPVTTQAPRPQAQPTAPRLEPGSFTSNDAHRSMWANAMSSVAAEFTARLPHLAPEERRAASFRAAALSSVARDLLTANKTQPLPPFALPPR